MTFLYANRISTMTIQIFLRCTTRNCDQFKLSKM